MRLKNRYKILYPVFLRLQVVNIVTNPVIEVITSRRSTRAYEPKPIPREIVRTIIEAGHVAPSMGRMEKDGSGIRFQPWRFVVVEDPKFRQKLVQAAHPIWERSINQMKGMFPDIHTITMQLYKVQDEPKDMVYYKAPVIVFVIGPKDAVTSCALACENIIIAAQSFGLGSCYSGFGSMVTGDPSIVQALELTEDERIYGPIVLGYPKDIPEAHAMLTKRRTPTIKWI